MEQVNLTHPTNLARRNKVLAATPPRKKHFIVIALMGNLRYNSTFQSNYANRGNQHDKQQALLHYALIVRFIEAAFLYKHFKDESSQLWKQLQLRRKESLKEIQTSSYCDILILVQYSTNWAEDPLGSTLHNLDRPQHLASYAQFNICLSFIYMIFLKS